MKTRTAKAKKNVESDRGDSSTSTNLDENLWGTLQHHIDLAENVYSKLPFEEFFHLRTVCKDWYIVACKRLGLKEPIHKPYFTLFAKGAYGQLDGILIYNALSRSWDWRPSWTHSPSFDFVASEGVVYSASPVILGNSCAYHWQSKTFQCLDPPPPPPNIYGKMILGMSISASPDSFSSLRVVRGGLDFDTQVYESGAWRTKPCRVPKPETGDSLWASTGSAYCNGRVYITTEHSREIFVFDFEKSGWSSLLSPGDRGCKQPEHYCLHTLGAWNGRIFDVTSDFESGRRKKNEFLQVWELVDEALHKWTVYDCMPKGLCSWLRCAKGFCRLYKMAGDISIQASFCGDYMLVYSWDFFNGSSGRFCLFNMATKNWQKLNISPGVVEIREDCLSDTYFDDPFDLYARAIESYLDEFVVGDDVDDPYFDANESYLDEFMVGDGVDDPYFDFRWDFFL